VQTRIADAHAIFNCGLAIHDIDASVRRARSDLEPEMSQCSRLLNGSITLSIIGEIRAPLRECAQDLCNPRAMSSVCISRPGFAQIVANATAGIGVGSRRPCRRSLRSPAKQAFDTKGAGLQRCDRMPARPRDTIFSDTYRKTPRGKRLGRK
jgi:hypothetical protein